MLRQTLFNMPGLSKNESVVLMQYLEFYPENSSLSSILAMLRNGNPNVIVRSKYQDRPLNQLSNDIVEQISNLNAVQSNSAIVLEDAGNGMMCGRRR